MSVGREDMLRELELLPVWRARVPVAGSVPSATQVESEALVPIEVTAAPLVAPGLESVPPQVNAEPEMLPALQEVQPEAPLQAHESHLNNIELADAVAPQTLLPHPELPQPIVEPLIQTPWLLYCPHANDAQTQLLLQNIVRALQLPLEDVVLHQQTVRMAQVKTRFCVLFGLHEANQFLGASFMDMAAVRGQVHTYDDLMVVVTHPPQAMLENPLLKREVWQDICLLLAKNAEVAT